MYDYSDTVRPGEWVCFIGPNGAGKTTTLSMLTGLLTPTAGSVKMLNGDLRENIGFLPQYPQFHPWLSALEFTEMAARLNGVSAKNAKKLTSFAPWQIYS